MSKLADELERLLADEKAALNSIKNQDHSAYNRAHTKRMNWLKSNSEAILTALQDRERTDRETED